jgi:hypothetical protein
MPRADLLSALASGLGLWPGLFLIAGGWAKARDPAGGRDTIVARALPDRIALRVAWPAAAAIELGVGLLVISALLLPWPEYAAALVLGVALLVSVWGLRHAPEAGCGCFGAQAAPVSARTVARAGVLAGLALAAAIGGEAWTSAFTEPVAVVVWLAAGAGLVLLSPELHRAPSSQRMRDVVCAVRHVPLERSLARLHGSELWRDARGHLSSDVPAETWQEGCWRYVCYPANYEGERATAVFALALRARTTNAVAFVDEERQRVLGQISGEPEPGTIK